MTDSRKGGAEGDGSTAPHLRAVKISEDAPAEQALEPAQPADVEIADRVTSSEVIGAVIEAAEGEEEISDLGAGLRKMVNDDDVSAGTLDQLWQREADRVRAHLEMQDIS